jgi:His-Xaa-Ser system protein HxsD
MAADPSVDIAGGVATVRFQSPHYSPDAVAAASHLRTGECYVQIKTADDGFTLVELRPRGSMVNLEVAARQLANDALDQQLRARIAAQTEPIRRLIIAQAFSKANLFAPELDTATLEQDPLHLRRQDGG